MPSTKAALDLSNILSIYIGPTATITGPDVDGNYTVTVPEEDLSQAQLDISVGIAENDQRAALNKQDLIVKMRDAVASNKTFLNIATPTNAQVVTQVKTLTRQMNVVLKMVGQDLMDTDGT
jgi:hypothetical protein